MNIMQLIADAGPSREDIIKFVDGVSLSMTFGGATISEKQEDVLRALFLSLVDSDS